MVRGKKNFGVSKTNNVLNEHPIQYRKGLLMMLGTNLNEKKGIADGSKGLG
jgi:hypothetical protein